PFDAPLLKADGLVKRFGGLVAVKDVSITLNRAEIVGLIGPNGAGKSTTFNLLTGALQPSSGSINVGGQPVVLTPVRAARHGIARTFQHVMLVAGMSVLDNVTVGAHLRGGTGAFAAMVRANKAEE